MEVVQLLVRKSCVEWSLEMKTATELSVEEFQMQAPIREIYLKYLQKISIYSL